MKTSWLSVLFLILGTTLFAQTERIITAGSAMTETVCALGLAEKIVATDRTSLYPAEMQKLPSIGYRTGISAEGIIALKPSLFIAEKTYVEEMVVNQIRSTGIKVIEVARAYHLAGTRNLIRTIANELGK